MMYDFAGHTCDQITYIGHARDIRGEARSWLVEMRCNHGKTRYEGTPPPDALQPRRAACCHHCGKPDLPEGKRVHPACSVANRERSRADARQRWAERQKEKYAAAVLPL